MVARNWFGEITGPIAWGAVVGHGCDRRIPQASRPAEDASYVAAVMSGARKASFRKRAT